MKGLCVSGSAEEQVTTRARHRNQDKLTCYRQAALPRTEEEPTLQTDEVIIRKSRAILFLHRG